MATQEISIDCHDGNIYVITMKKAPENRLNTQFAQGLIKALRDIEKSLGSDSEGAVIIRGNDAKFWCTVCPLLISKPVSPFLRRAKLQREGP
jgi:enoyl-CoA hydratase/carnithine racemase